MPTLLPETVLLRAPEIALKVSAYRHVEIDLGGRVVITNEHALALVRAFARPTSVGRALAELSAGSAEDWIELSSTLLHLYEAGVLCEPSSPTIKEQAEGFDASMIHVRMLLDGVRTTRFLDAIRAVVRPGDVVVDIGTGTGVLAIAAAKAGARRVFAIEETTIGEVARDMFAGNGVADRVTLIAGRSTRVDLPERADVLVTETLGNDIFDEQILETTRDANLRLLKPDARRIPTCIRVFAVLLEVPGEELARQGFVAENRQKWRDLYGIDFEALSRHRTGDASIFRPAHALREWRRLTKPVLLADVDLARIERTDLEAAVAVSFEDSGTATGVQVYFEANLSPNVSLSIERDQNELESWTTRVWLLPEPIPVKPGDHRTIHYSYRGKSRLTVR